MRRNTRGLYAGRRFPRRRFPRRVRRIRGAVGRRTLAASHLFNNRRRRNPTKYFEIFARAKSAACEAWRRISPRRTAKAMRELLADRLWKDVLPFPCLKVVVGFYNVSMSVGRNVKSRPLSAGGEPRLPFAKYGHTLNWNVCESVGCPCVNNFKLIRSRQRQVLFLQMRSKLVEVRREL